MGLWDIVVPVTSVVVTGGVAIWSKIIDARSKREDRQHARALEYESRVWQAKNDALRRIISASRAVKRWTEIYQSQLDPADMVYNRARLAQQLGRFKNEIGGEDGVSEIVAYASEPVRDAVDEMFSLIEERLRSHRVALFTLNNTDTQLELLRLAARDQDGGPVTDPMNRLQEHAALQERQSTAIAKLEAVEIDVGTVAKLCDRIIDVARQDIQGR